MPAVVVLEGAENLAVQPGQTATCQLSIANTGTIVEQFVIMFMGDVAPWASAEPPVVSLFPGARQSLTITFAPPRDPTTPAGVIPFGVKVIPSNEPDESITEEGALTVGTFTDIGAELLPRVTSGRLAGKQRLAVDSRGNAPIPVIVSAIDAADALKFRVGPDHLTAAPGAAHFVRIRVAPRQRFWKGPNQQKPYQVHVEVEGERPLVLDGGFTQKAVLPKWALPAALIAAALILLWFFVLRPSVKNAAVNAAVTAQKAALATQAQKTAAAQAAAQQAQKQNSQTAAALATTQKQLNALQGKKPAPTTTTTTTTVVKVTKATTTTKPPPPPPVTGPTDGSLEVSAAPGTTATVGTAAVATGSTLQLTDLIIQNISGMAGTAHVERVLPNNGGTQDLLVEDLGNLATDQQYTFNTPMVFTHGQVLELRVDCNGDQPACIVGMYYAGPITQPVADTTTTLP